jgi:hypothetical protein
VLTIAVAPAAAAPAATHHGSCHTRACFRRSCRSHACKARVARKLAIRHKRATVAPYRGWLARTRWCESRGNYRAISPGGRYRGAYQFDLDSWQRAGGRGDPVDAGKLEQDFRAVRWLQAVGRGAWPVCG